MTGFQGNRDELMDALCRIAVQAGAAIMDHYETDIVVNQKDDKSPVTAADQEAEDIILPASSIRMANLPSTSH